MRKVKSAVRTVELLEYLAAKRDRAIVETLPMVGDKVTRVLRPVANGDKWFAQ